MTGDFEREPTSEVVTQLLQLGKLLKFGTAGSSSRPPVEFELLAEGCGSSPANAVPRSAPVSGALHPGFVSLRCLDDAQESAVFLGASGHEKHMHGTEPSWNKTVANNGLLGQTKK